MGFVFENVIFLIIEQNLLLRIFYLIWEGVIKVLAINLLNKNINSWKYWLENQLLFFYDGLCEYFHYYTTGNP